MTVDTRTGEITLTEAAQREALEVVVEKGLATFVEVGQALAQINSARLYRSTHTTFAEYARDRFGIGRSHAYRLIDAAKVADAVSPIGDIVNEAQARALAGLSEGDAQSVYQVAQGISALCRGSVHPNAAELTDVRRNLDHPPAIAGVPADDVVDAEIVEDEPVTPVVPITGRDGKTYARPEPPPPPTEAQRAAIEQHQSRERASKIIAESTWHLANAARGKHAADRLVGDWQPVADIYPEKTTAARLRAAAQLLNDLAERWHK